MSNQFRTLALAALLAGGTAAVTVAPAQDKGKPPAKKDDAKKGKKGTGTVEVNEGKDGKFRFVVRNADGKLLAMSGPTGFVEKADAVAALDELKAVLETAKVESGKKKAPKEDEKDEMEEKKDKKKGGKG